MESGVAVVVPEAGVVPAQGAAIIDPAQGGALAGYSTGRGVFTSMHLPQK